MKVTLDFFFSCEFGTTISPHPISELVSRLEIFNAVILHNLSTNPNMLYGILSAHKTFEDLGTFTLSRGLREIRRVQLAKEEQARKADLKGKGPRVLGDDSQPHEEKAKLLRTESETALALSESAEVQEGSPRASQGQDPEISMVLPTSPTSETIPASTSTSEKARGKMKARRSQSLDTTGLDHVAAAGIGRNGFVPTQEWVCYFLLRFCAFHVLSYFVKGYVLATRVSALDFMPNLGLTFASLPLDSVMLLVSELLPKVQEMQASRHRTTSTSAIVEFLGTVNLQHVLPPAPPLAPRRFMVINLWYDAYAFLTVFSGRILLLYGSLRSYGARYMFEG